MAERLELHAWYPKAGGFNSQCRQFAIQRRTTLARGGPRNTYSGACILVSPTPAEEYERYRGEHLWREGDPGTPTRVPASWFRQRPPKNTKGLHGLDGISRLQDNGAPLTPNERGASEVIKSVIGHLVSEVRSIGRFPTMDCKLESPGVYREGWLREGAREKHPPRSASILDKFAHPCNLHVAKFNQTC